MLLNLNLSSNKLTGGMFHREEVTLIGATGGGIFSPPVPALPAFLMPCPALFEVQEKGASLAGLYSSAELNLHNGTGGITQLVGNAFS